MDDSTEYEKGLVQVLEMTISSNTNQLSYAAKYLKEQSQNNLPNLMRTLSSILANTSYSQASRMAGGLQLKNYLTSKDHGVKVEYRLRWMSFSVNEREYIKQNILRALGTENSRPSSAAQCIAYVALIELPLNAWPTLISYLVSKVCSVGMTEKDKESALEAIGYICQEISAGAINQQSNQILTAIVHGMRQQELSNKVRLAATTALYNSLEFTRGNFNDDRERNFLMEVVCEATQSTDAQIAVAALQCLVKIISLYYSLMEPYMGPLFQITYNAIKSDNEQIALQGIEFWTTICDEESDILLDCQDPNSNPQVSKYYAKGALTYIVPALLKRLTEQNEWEIEDLWGLGKSASVCLTILTTCVEDSILPIVLPFIYNNIKSPDWRNRDAALIAFGSIVGGLEVEALKPLVEQTIPELIKLMYDTSVRVRHTTAWTFGKICEYTPEATLKSTYLQSLLECLVNALDAEPLIAANICWALVGLVEAAAEEKGANPSEAHCLIPYFPYIVQKLLDTTERTENDQANLRVAAYEALIQVIKNSPDECYDIVKKTTITILERINNVVSSDECKQMSDLQSLLCATLQSVLQKMRKEDAPQVSDTIMQLLFTMFEKNALKTAIVLEDALTAISTLIELLGIGFNKYMERFMPYLRSGIINYRAHEVCTVAIGLVSDLCRALKHLIQPYCDEIMNMLISNLHQHDLHPNVKPTILTAFGDMALSIGSQFKKYLRNVMHVLYIACQFQAVANDYDSLMHENELHESIIDSYTGIVQGLKGTDPNSNRDIEPLIPYLGNIIGFIRKISIEIDAKQIIVGNVAGLVGDLCNIFGNHLSPFFEDEVITKFLLEGKKSKIKQTHKMCAWALKEIKKIRYSTHTYT